MGKSRKTKKNNQRKNKINENITNENITNENKINENKTNENEARSKMQWLIPVLISICGLAIGLFQGIVPFIIANMEQGQAETSLHTETTQEAAYAIQESQTITPMQDDIVPDLQCVSWDDIVYSFEPLFPIDILMRDRYIVGDWLYFIYPVEFDDISYSALFRMRNDSNNGPAYQVSWRAVDRFHVVGDNVFFVDYTLLGRDHGELYVSRPDGRTCALLAYSLGYYQIVGDYIFYSYRHTTLGVGPEGFALHRINLDGSNPTLVAYSPLGLGISGSDFREQFVISNGWVYVGNFRMRLGNPADGFEELQILSPSEDGHSEDWIFYITNRLIMARRDGTERIQLHYEEGFWGYVYNTDDEWIYFRSYLRLFPEFYKIRRDGSGLTPNIY